DESIASVMNDFFVCVKVDREERPDVDHVFMDAVQQLHGSGGWPLNCFALPDGRPFWGGTYFRPEQWRQLLENVHELYQNRYAELEQQATEIADGVAMQNQILKSPPENKTSQADFEAIFNILHTSFDMQEGGLQGAPKFPLPVVLRFLLDYYMLTNNETSLYMVELSLQKMACGGIYDQAGGGFARYSTDASWKVPHFEKMLYDNAQLISLYSSAWLHNNILFYKEIVEQTIDFTDRELTAPEGVFYSALDADSEGEEGLFYTWTQEQFAEALGHYAELGGEYYGVGNKGLWEHGRNILMRVESDDLFAQRHYLSAEELASLTAYCRSQLLKTRSERTRPALDDKMLVSWNALMISALVDAHIAFGREDYLQPALHAARFIVSNLKRPGSGLFHTWKPGRAQVNAFLDDYAFACKAFIDLYTVTADAHWLAEAEGLAAYVVEHFYDMHSGFFWYSENADNQVFARKIEIYDGVIPSGNSTMAWVLNTLGIFLHNNDYAEKSRQMISSMESRFSRSPAAYSNWASLALSAMRDPFVVAVVGPDCVARIRELKLRNLPGTLIFGSKTASPLPYFADRFVEGKTLIYVCSGTHCQLPVETVDAAAGLIVNGKAG
ncbi:MAG TPA: thioredoxin domain-containing protein, partial [Bacteroidales bacterium]|nr:thioredoxin domain-containing protein [Bacteroidales bacterium]